MDRGAWWATVHGITTVGHDLVSKPPRTLLGTGNIIMAKPEYVFVPRKLSCEWVTASHSEREYKEELWGILGEGVNGT